MSKEELLKIFDELSSGIDPESAHSKADDILLQFINDAEVSAAYKDIPRWYA